MKFITFMLLFASIVFAYGEEKIYFSLEKLSFSNEGIFLTKVKCIIQLPFIQYDDGGYYIVSNPREGVTIVKCAACHLNTWWIERHCCLFEDCPYYCY